MAGSAGNGWWSRRFVELVGSFAGEDLLRRGLACAREGRVTGLAVGPYEATAHVRGDGPEPYEVAVGIDAIDAAGWAAAEAELASRAVFRARLLAGELPPEIEPVLAGLGLPLFPASAAGLHVMCGCPDWGDACEHAAAVLCALAEAFGDDPFLVLAWNGRTKDELLTALRRRPAPSGPPGADGLDGLDGADGPGGEPLGAEDFWTTPSGLARLRDRPPAPPVPPGFVLEVVAPPPVKVRRRDLASVLAPAYHALATERLDDGG
ncbi:MULTISPECIES: hypothetical protein [Thermomonosporaceae]|uniref:SWIM zinc finger family protein n=1 Tax=Thermomonosporaceae TaxID=2012 RepID=UPI00255AC853|nr:MULTISPECIES: hypothetical protein [Thermomonosporaceae]MDL4771778.1 hypothetical protein [Actinomadura xylanilytica]